MCGIIAILDEESINNEDLQLLRDLIDKRGPDFQSPFSSVKLKHGPNIKLKASVLHLRGDELRQQPVIDEWGNILLFNGQIYEYDNRPLQEEISDTSFILDQLRLCRSKLEIANTFSKIDGPFAFIYWNADLSSLFYGRDFFGRKSLCYLQAGENPYPSVISSVSTRQVNSDNPCGHIWYEVNCLGFHCLEFNSCWDKPSTSRFMWNIDEIYPRTSRCQPVLEEEGTEYIFLKTSLLAPLNDDLKCHSDFTAENIKNATLGLGERLINSVKKRYKYNRKTCLECRRNAIPERCEHSKVSVAFSGGVDSTLIALALDKVLEQSETIDLLTVAFKEESPDRISVGSAFKELRKLCPYRNWRLVLSDITKPELQMQRDKVIGHLIAPCNTVVDDSLGCGCWFISRGQGRAFDSMRNDIEFESIFESFLKFSPTNDCNGIDWWLYTSPATMFFAGMSIDEQLGGYSSHRAAWSKSGTAGLFEEISMQMRRISSRNLGRDDRCCSHHGRDVKFPYLDYDLVSYLNQLSIGLKMNLDDSLDWGPKQLLRALALDWGLETAARRTKRALQFGTRIANLENPKERGNDICSRLT